VCVREDFILAVRPDRLAGERGLEEFNWVQFRRVGRKCSEIDPLAAWG
jgi:hypothetical protein